MNMHNAKCFASHLGEWAILPTFLQQAVAAIKGGLWKGGGNEAGTASGIFAARAAVVVDENNEPMYFRTGDGVAIVRMSGPMMKSRSKYGGVSTIDQRKNMRAIMSDEKAKSALLIIDSPGGTVAGTEALAADIKSLDLIKPVLTYFEDLGASAAYWTGAQARRISANASAQVGSLGVYGVVVDSSGKAEKEGVEVHVISTGENKGAFVPGAPVTEKQLSSYQDLINKMNDQFKDAVMSGRKLPKSEIDKLFDGSVWMADDAKKLGLIDAVESLDQAIAEATKVATASQNNNSQIERERKLKLAKV